MLASLMESLCIAATIFTNASHCSSVFIVAPNRSNLANISIVSDEPYRQTRHLASAVCEPSARPEARSVRNDDFNLFLSCNRTCEIGMTRATGKKYVHVLEELAARVAE